MEEQAAASARVVYGYNGKLLRVDLSRKKTYSEVLDEEVLKKFVGGATLGISYVYKEVPPEINWSDAENRIYFFTGPLSGGQHKFKTPGFR